MYLLLKKDGTFFKLKNGETYVVGRKDCDIILEDKAVSKKHAKITVKNDIVYITDLKSSNKTTVNDTHLRPNVETIVKLGSTIIFGLPEANFILKKDEIIITMSGLSKTDKDQMLAIMKALSGSVLANWSPTCTHIVTSEMILTVKVLSALISKQPVVSVDYFVARQKHFEGKGALPKVEDFQPPPSRDTMLKNKGPIDYSLDRTKLFKNKIFVFPNDQSKKKIDSVIKLAGGSSISYTSKPLVKNRLITPDVEYVFIITQDDTQSENNEFNDCIKYLKEHNRRSVPLSEIAIAVLLGSCQTECNPLFNKVKHIMSAEKSSDFGTSEDVESQTQFKTNKPQDIDSMMCVPSSQSQMTVDEVVDDSQMKNTQEKSSFSLSITQKNVKGKASQSKINSFFKRSNVPSTSEASSKKSTQLESIVIDDDDDDEPIPSTSSKRKSPDLEESSQKKLKLDSGQKSTKAKENISKFATSTQNSIPDEPAKRKSFFEEDESSPKPKKSNIPFNIAMDEDEDFTMKNKKDYRNNPFFAAANKSKLTVSKQKTSPRKSFDMDFDAKPTSSSLSMSNKQTGSLFNKKSVTSKDIPKNEENAPSKRKRSPCIEPISKKPFNETSNILTSTRIEEDSFIKPTSVSSYFENSTNLCRWLKKDTPSICEKKSEELDEATRGYIAGFKTAMIEVIPSASLIIRKLRDCSLSSRDTINNSSNSKPSFKKFKKALPLRPQTHIISSSDYVTVLCGENARQRVIEKNVEVLENARQEEDVWEEEEEEEGNAFEFNF